MKLFGICVFVALTFCSCATLLNNPNTSINVYSDVPAKFKVDEFTYHIEKKREKIRVRRDSATLTLIARVDSVTKTIILKPVNSFAYYANILSLGLGTALDKGPKRYTYQKNVYLDFKSKSTMAPRFASGRKGQTNLVLSLPHINSFYLQSQDESTEASTGFFGISAGLDKYYSARKFINVYLSANLNFIFPIPAPVEYSIYKEPMSTGYLGLTDNIQYRNFSIGYGVNYATNTWDNGDPVESSTSFGLILNGYYRFSKYFYGGIIYRPSLITVEPVSEFRYEHLISIDFAWKIRLKK